VSAPTCHSQLGFETPLSEVRLFFYVSPNTEKAHTRRIDNILFDLPYNEERYRKTLEVCALLSDLKILEDGDMSEIGERGVCV
jgi:hypothetical protein